MKNKKVIRLTESDLHNVIKESVQQVLMEMDPRTYANAAEKARLRHQYDRAKNFKQGAIDAWNRDYEDEVGKSKLTDIIWYDGSVPFDCWVGNEYPDGRGDTLRFNSYYPYRDEDDTDYRTPYIKNVGNGPMHLDHPRTNGKRVAKQMISGNGKYVKGKGWQ